MRRGVWLVVAAVAFWGAGCSFHAPSRQVVALNVFPKDSEVIVNGLLYPGGSIYIEVPPNRELLITAQKPRFLPEKRVVPIGLSSTGKFDACGSILILPFFGLYSPGAWQLEESVVNITLLPDPAAADEEAEKTADAPVKTEKTADIPVETEKTADAPVAEAK